MPTWVTIETAVDRYVAGAERLLDYARRGNLPVRRAAHGEVFVDEAVVARFFRPRHPGVIRYPQSSGPSLGILGVQRLGLAPNARDGRQRGLIVAQDREPTTDAPGVAPRKAAG